MTVVIFKEKCDFFWGLEEVVRETFEMGNCLENSLQFEINPLQQNHLHGQGWLKRVILTSALLQSSGRFQKKVRKIFVMGRAAAHYKSGPFKKVGRFSSLPFCKAKWWKSPTNFWLFFSCRIESLPEQPIILRPI